MKKFCVIFCVIIFFIVTFFLTKSFVESSKKKQAKNELLKTEAYEYLYDKYSKKAVFEVEPRFYDSVYFFHDVHFENEKVYFDVRYIVPASKFEDDYVEDPYYYPIRYNEWTSN